MSDHAFKKLIVWNDSMNLMPSVYGLIKLLPKEENFALADQMRRAAISIPSNIAEGNGRDSLKDYIHFLYIANGSLNELETQIYICVKLNYFTLQTAEPVISSLEKLSVKLCALIRSLKAKLTNEI